MRVGWGSGSGSTVSDTQGWRVESSGDRTERTGFNARATRVRACVGAEGGAQGKGGDRPVGEAGVGEGSGGSFLGAEEPPR